tara:strand:- start:1937 stop:2275 length:339 start_codon:yes stop_codon:yes gene_type:complete
MFKKIQRYFKRKKYLSQAVIPTAMIYADINTREIIVYELLENGNGDRKVDVINQGKLSETLDSARQHPYYLEFILPWEKQLTDVLPTHKMTMRQLLTLYPSVSPRSSKAKKG